MTEQIIINGIDVSECCYAILPKKQCPMKSMPYAKETSCTACKENNTKLNFCKNNPNCYYKQLKRKEQKCRKYKKCINNIRIINKDLFNDICDNCGWHNTDSCDPEDCVCESLIKIKQIINEVENE